MIELDNIRIRLLQYQVDRGGYCIYINIYRVRFYFFLGLEIIVNWRGESREDIEYIFYFVVMLGSEEVIILVEDVNFDYYIGFDSLIIEMRLLLW